jgi:hypothetical protein
VAVGLAALLGALVFLAVVHFLARVCADDLEKTGFLSCNELHMSSHD